MFARRLVVSLFLGALLAGSTAGVSAGGGFKLPGVVLLPPLVNVPLPLACHVQYDGGNTFVTLPQHGTRPESPEGHEDGEVPRRPQGFLQADRV